ncbi:MAG: hypothetical protein ACLRSW_05740 [Christensenellaceae bacterium]
MTDGGRVLGVCAKGATIEEARQRPIGTWKNPFRGHALPRISG